MRNSLPVGHVAQSRGNIPSREQQTLPVTQVQPARVRLPQRPIQSQIGDPVAARDNLSADRTLLFASPDSRRKENIVLEGQVPRATGPRALWRPSISKQTARYLRHWARRMSLFAPSPYL